MADINPWSGAPYVPEAQPQDQHAQMRGANQEPPGIPVNASQSINPNPVNPNPVNPNPVNAEQLDPETLQALNLLTQMGMNSMSDVVNTVQSLQAQLQQARIQNVPEQHHRQTPLVDQMQDVQNIRTVAVSTTKPANPKFFSKQTYAGELMMWIDTMRAYIQADENRGIFKPEREKINLAASYLDGDARIKWGARQRIDMRRLPDDPRKINTLEQFFAYLMQYHSKWNEQDKIRKKYMKLRQRRSVSEYGQELLLLADLLEPRPSDKEVLERFKYGLQNQVREALAHTLNKPEGLEDFMQLCDEIDNSIYEYRTSKESKEHLYSMSQQSGSKDEASNRPKKGTPEWNTWCRKDNRCLNCGKVGHRIAQCRSKKNSNKPKQENKGTDQSSNPNPSSVTLDVSKLDQKNKGNGQSRT